MLLLLMRGCDIAASAYNAAGTPATANATNAIMLIMQDLKISMQQCL